MDHSFPRKRYDRIPWSLFSLVTWHVTPLGNMMGVPKHFFFFFDKPGTPFKTHSVSGRHAHLIMKGTLSFMIMKMNSELYGHAVPCFLHLKKPSSPTNCLIFISFLFIFLCPRNPFCCHLRGLLILGFFQLQQHLLPPLLDFPPFLPLSCIRNIPPFLLCMPITRTM